MLFSQDSSMKLSAAAAALALIPSVAAHGYVSSIVTGGKTYIGSNPNWYYQPSGSVVDTAGWFALNQDNGFVSPDSYGTSDIACHKSAKPGTLQIPVTAGDSVTLVWNTWPDTHKGPVIDYMAKCSGSCTSASAAALDFFKIDQQGLIDDSTPPGTWATDDLISASPAFSWKVTIPSSLASGSYVLRHEIIALHAAGSANGAQNYPQCINFAVTGSGSAAPAGEPATSFYKEDDPGILISIYNQITNYIIPGPAVAALGGGGSSGGSGGSAPTTVSAPKTTMVTSTKPATTAAKPSTTAAAPVPTTSSSSGGAALYAQCGGQGWTGPTTCVSGTCKASGSYYSQCLP